MDDSGSQDGAHNCVIGGYWGSVNEWRRFDREWRKALNDEKIEEFKANEFWLRIPNVGRIGPYKDWNDERHHRFIDSLLRVIENHKIYPFASGVLNSVWDIQPEHYRRVYSRTDNPKHDPLSLLMPLQFCIIRTATHCHSGITMDFSFDDNPSNKKLKSRMAAYYLDLKQQVAEDNDPLKDHLGSFGFEDSKTATPIQAADLLAYEAHRYARQAKGNGQHPVRSSYFRALRRFRSQDDFWLFDANRFLQMNAALEATAR